MGWWVPNNSLSARQYQLITQTVQQRNTSNVIWIKGFAGTGKTLVLLHMMENIANLEPQSSLCFLTYTNSLVDLVSSSPVFTRGRSGFDKLTHTMFIHNKKSYDYVFIDEIQDIKPEHLSVIKRYSKHVVIAGDPDQQIYDNGSSVNDIMSFYTPRVETLHEVFRITKNICKLAISINPNIQIVEGLLAARKNSSINIGRADNKSGEYFWVLGTAVSRARPGAPSAIIFHTHREIEEFGHELINYLISKGYQRPPYLKRFGKEGYEKFNDDSRSLGLPYRFIGTKSRTYGESDNSPIVFITTAHSAKGLDFNNVFLPNLNSGAYQVKRNTTVDDYTRRLLVVAITRSRENLYLTYSSNRPVDFIEKVPSDIASKFRITSQGEATSTTNKLSDTLPLRITISLEKVDDGNFF